MPIGLGCQIQILEDQITKTKVGYEKKIKKLRKELKKVKILRGKQYEKRVTGLPSKAQLAKRKRVAKAKAKRIKIN